MNDLQESIKEIQEQYPEIADSEAMVLTLIDLWNDSANMMVGTPTNAKEKDLETLIPMLQQLIYLKSPCRKEELYKTIQQMDPYHHFKTNNIEIDLLFR